MISSLDNALNQNENLVKECYNLTKKLKQSENELMLYKNKLYDLESASNEKNSTGQNPEPEKDVDGKFNLLHKKYKDSVKMNAENVEIMGSLKEEIHRLERKIHKADLRIQELELLPSADGNLSQMEVSNHLKDRNEEIMQLKVQIRQQDLSYSYEINSRNKTIHHQQHDLKLLENQMNRMIFVIQTLTLDRNALRETCAKIGQDVFVKDIALTTAKDQISKLSGKLLEQGEVKTTALESQVLIDKLDKLEEHLIEIKDSMGTITSSTKISEFDVSN